MGRGAFPYFMPGSGRISFGPWIDVSGDPAPLVETLEDWDAESRLPLTQAIEVDLPGLLADTGLPRGVPLVVTASWTSSVSGMRSIIARENVDPAGRALLRAELDGQRVAGTLELLTTLSLAQTLPEVPLGVARRPGSILGSSTISLDTEPRTTRFPISVIDFAATKLDAEASWRLETTTDLHAPFFGEYRLLINSRDNELVNAIEKRAPVDRDRVLVGELEGQVAALLYDLSLIHREAIEEFDEWPEDSVGGVLLGFLESARDFGLYEASSDAVDKSRYVSRLSALARSRGQGREFS